MPLARLVVLHLQYSTPCTAETYLLGSKMSVVAAYKYSVLVKQKS